MLAVAALLVLLTAVAELATLLELRSAAPGSPDSPGALTVILADGKAGPSAAIAVVGSSGKLRSWRSPERQSAVI